MSKRDRSCPRAVNSVVSADPPWSSRVITWMTFRGATSAPATVGGEVRAGCLQNRLELFTVPIPVVVLLDQRACPARQAFLLAGLVTKASEDATDPGSQGCGVAPVRQQRRIEAGEDFRDRPDRRAQGPRGTGLGLDRHPSGAPPVVCWDEDHVRPPIGLRP